MQKIVPLLLNKKRLNVLKTKYALGIETKEYQIVLFPKNHHGELIYRNVRVKRK